MTIKIWAAVTLLVVLGWLLLLRRFRAALQVMFAGSATATIICLPFLLAAPTAMWNQIVRDQFFRHRTLGDTIFGRLQSTVGLDIVERSSPAITLAAVAALLGAAALAWSYREARLPVLLMLGQGAVLLTTPFWLSHFAAFTAAMVALTAGAATGRLIALIRAGPLRIAVGAILAAVLLGYASGWRTVIFGGPFPKEFRAITDAAPGCVTSDDPTALVLTDSLSRNLRRGCQLIADVGGNSHDLAAASGRKVSRNRNQAFQRFALDYLGTGSVTILLRYSGDQGFNMKTTAVLEQWPLLARSGLFELRQPVEPGRSEGIR
jgi:alpha-1,2-mannosyltransferase